MELQQTERGFEIIRFTDRYQVECSLQKSSIATEDCIWFGANNIGLKEFVAYEGWKDRPEFDEFSYEHHFNANTRMHLSREQVKELLPFLQAFADTGELSAKPVNNLLTEAKALYADVLGGFSGCEDEHTFDYRPAQAIEERLEKIIAKYR